MKLAVVAAPYISSTEHLALAKETMASLRFGGELDRIAVVNRFPPEESALSWLGTAFDVVEWNEQNHLARAWNRGIQQGFERGAEYVLVINLDIVLHSQCIERLLQFAETHREEVLWSAVPHDDLSNLEQVTLAEEIFPHIHFSCFLVGRRLPETVGLFDEQFAPAYYEDCDLRRRLLLAGFSEIATRAALFYHEGSATIRGADAEDYELLAHLGEAFVHNPVRYQAKWGGPPYHEVYTEPYNGNPPR